MSSEVAGPRDSEYGWFDVVTRFETYLGILYLLISFPLGVFYLCLFVTWLALGAGLLVLIIGIPILGLMFLAARGLAGFERHLSNWLLDAGIPAGSRMTESWEHPWRTFKACLADAFTWRGLLFLFLKFPLGVVSFVLSVVLACFSLALIVTPFLYRYAPITYFDRRINSPEAALACLVSGLILGVLTLYIANGVSAIWRALSRALLTPSQAAPTAPPPKSGPIVIP